MFCTNCGSKLESEMKFCPNCGAPVQAAQENKTNDGAVPQEVPPTLNSDENGAPENAQAPAQETAYTPPAYTPPPVYAPPVYTPPVYGVPPYAPPQVPDRPEDRGKPFHSGLAPAIVFTVLAIFTANVLALITGIIGLVFAGLASGRKNAGDMPAARSHAKAAKALNITTIILTVLWIILIIVVFGFAFRMALEMLENGTYDDFDNITPEQIEEFLENYGDTVSYRSPGVDVFVDEDGETVFVKIPGVNVQVAGSGERVSVELPAFSALR